MEQRLFVRMREARPEQRKQLYEEIYDRGAGVTVRPDDIPASGARRRRRIALYRRIIGGGNRAILETGCGTGDLTCALADLAERVVGIDLSARNLAMAQQRALGAQSRAHLEFIRMNAIELEFRDGSFDWAISTSMIEHLHPDDVAAHLGEVRRVLAPGGRYLVWCPNRLGHHGDRDFHLCMLSYRELMEKMRAAGFGGFRSTLFRGMPLVDARFKVIMEDALTALHVGVMWSHLGVRNILLVGQR